MPVKSIRMFLATTALECSAPVNHGHCQAAQRAFEELEQEFDNLPEPIPYRLTLFDVKAWPEKARELEITSLPTLLFQIDDAYVVARLLGSQINTANIKTMIRKLIMATELGEGKYDSDGVKFGNGESFKLAILFKILMPAVDRSSSEAYLAVSALTVERLVAQEGPENRPDKFWHFKKAKAKAKFEAFTISKL
ncbi:MAG: thioredoxin family protein, partial [Bacteroidota bacterium]